MTQATIETAPKNNAPAPPTVAIERQPVSDAAVDAFTSLAGFEAAQRMAKSLVTSSLVPDVYKNNLPNVLIALDMASRIGMSPFMVMQNLNVIHGRAGFGSSFLIATVNTSGRFSKLKFRFEGKPGARDWGCRAVARDRDDGEECLGALVTIGLAQDEGWTKKNGSKWLTMPEQMLMYRAAAFWTRVYAPELALGMQTTEEIADVTEWTQLPSASNVVGVPSAIAPGNAKSLEAELLATTPAPASEAPARTKRKPDSAGGIRFDPSWDAEAEAKPSTQAPKPATLPHDPQTGELLPKTGELDPDDNDAQEPAGVEGWQP